MKTLKKITFALFFVALGTTAFSQDAIPTLLPNGKVVMIEQERNQYQDSINDDEDDEQVNTAGDAYAKESCKECYVNLRTTGDQSSSNVVRIPLYDPRRK